MRSRTGARVAHAIHSKCGSRALAGSGKGQKISTFLGGA